MPVFIMAAFKKVFFWLFFEAFTGISVFPAQYFSVVGAIRAVIQAGLFREIICP